VGKRDLRRFIQLPWQIYRDDPNWVPPLISEVRKMLSSRHNPFFLHSQAQLFLAERDGRPVGRIAAICNRRHLEVYDDGVGFFGFFDCEDDQEAATALLVQAAEWLGGHGLQAIRGPFSLTINDESGLLVDGFSPPPMIMMPHNPPYYQRLLEDWGLVKIQDLFAFRIDVPESLPERLQEVESKLAERHGITIRCADLKQFDAEVERIHSIHSQAWADNWGAVPLTRQEMTHLAAGLKQIVDPDLVLIAEDRGEPIGISVTVPDLNQTLHRINGRLLPFGIIRLLWHARHIDAVRVLIMGVLKPYRFRAVDAAMYARSMTAAKAKGYRWGEMSWILESNRPMIRVLERLGATCYKTYRLYEKRIGHAENGNRAAATDPADSSG
jgi:hypothetical protein